MKTKTHDPGLSITPHEGKDWCHLCGQRQSNTADVFYGENAEHLYLGLTAKGHRARYVRICDICAERIRLAATGTRLKRLA